MLHRFAFMLAALLLVLAIPAAPPPALAAPSTPRAERLDDGTNATQTLTFSGQGYEFTEIAIEVTGAGTSVDYSLTSRICVTDTTCSAWEATPLASGTLAGDTTAQTVTIGPLTAPRSSYRLTLTVTGSPSSMKAWVVRH